MRAELLAYRTWPGQCPQAPAPVMKREREDNGEEKERRARRPPPALLPAPPSWNPLDLPEDMRGEIDKYLGCAPLHRLSVARRYTEETRKRLMFWLLKRDLYQPLMDIFEPDKIRTMLEKYFLDGSVFRERIDELLVAIRSGPAAHSRLQIATLYAAYMDWVLIPGALQWIGAALSKAIQNYLSYDTLPALREAEVCTLSTPAGTPVALFRLRLAAYPPGVPPNGIIAFDVRLLPGANLRQTSWYTLLEALGRSDHRIAIMDQYHIMETTPVVRALAGVLRTLMLEEGTECVLGIRGQRLVPRLPTHPTLSFPSCIVNLARVGVGKVDGPVLDQNAKLYPNGLFLWPGTYMGLIPVPVEAEPQ